MANSFGEIRFLLYDMLEYTEDVVRLSTCRNSKEKADQARVKLIDALSELCDENERLHRLLDAAKRHEAERWTSAAKAFGYKFKVDHSKDAGVKIGDNIEFDKSGTYSIMHFINIRTAHTKIFKELEDAVYSSTSGKGLLHVMDGYCCIEIEIKDLELLPNVIKKLREERVDVREFKGSLIVKYMP